jgi:hypothetical protein
VTGSCCEQETDTNSAFANRARILIMRGFKPKDAVELVLHEVAIEWGSQSETDREGARRCRGISCQKSAWA